MKQLFLLCCVALLCSCGITKKTTNNEKSNTDSTGNKSSIVTQVKKIEATDTAKTSSTTKKTTEGTYKKTTKTVREYFGDEFGFDVEDTATAHAVVRFQKIDTADFPLAAKQTKTTDRKPIYRETTTIEEEGAQKAVEDAAMLHEQTSKIAASDSSNENKKQSSNVSASQETKATSKFDLSIVPWWLLLLIIAIIVWVVIRRINK